MPARPSAAARALREECAAFAAGLAVLGLVGAWLARDGGDVAAPDRAATVEATPADDARRSDDALPREAPAVASYTLDVQLDPTAHVVTGRGTMRLRNVSTRPLRSVWLHLYLNAFAHEDTIFRSTARSGFRGNDGALAPGKIDVASFRDDGGAELWPHARFPDSNDRTEVEVPLAAAIEPGATARFEVEFTSTLPEIVLRTGHAGSFHMVGQWFPKFAKLETSGAFVHFPFERYSEFYADFGDYDVTITTPDAFTTVATGREVERTQAAGATTRRFVQRSVIDFAFSSWDGFEVRKRTTEAGVELTCAFPSGEGARADTQLDAVTRGLSFFGEAYGSYPYETLTLVHPPDQAAQAGGMEYPTLITTGATAPAFTGIRDLEIVTLHELAHQWFMGIVATNENAWPFLDEGVTSYATGLAMDALYADGVAPRLGFPVSLDALERMVQLGAHDAAPVASPASRFPTGRDYSALVYQRTATVLRTLDRVYEGAGQRAVRDHARAQRFAHPGPEALSAAVGRAVPKESSREAVAFFDGAIFQKGSLDYAIEAVPELSNEVTIQRRGALLLPTEVLAIDAAGVMHRVPVPASAVDAAIEIPTAERLVTVCVDPDRRLLVDELRANDCASVEPASVAPRSATLVSLTLAAALGVVLP